jgi:hypothetical protein
LHTAEAQCAAAVDVFLELLETAFHQILFLRELYPPRAKGRTAVDERGAKRYLPVILTLSLW